MDVSPKTLRAVEFREKLRGYHPEDVDQFLEQVAVGLEGMQDRLRQAVERAQRAETAAEQAAAAPIDTASNDETLRKTLVLAQRTADLAVQEAREQAARILSSAEQQAQARVAEAEERARRTHEDALSDIRSELSSLEVTRQRAQQEVDSLNRWVEEHRAQISSSLSEALSLVERVGVRSPAPVSRPIDVPPSPRGDLPRPARPGPGAAPPTAPPGPSGGPPGPPSSPSPPPPPRPAPPASAGPPAAAGPPPAVAQTSRPSGPRPNAPSFRAPSAEERVGDAGPPTVAWSPSPAEREALGRDDDGDPTPGQGTPAVADHRDVDPEDQALDDFFEDDDDYAGERKFGGRLRRRR